MFENSHSKSYYRQTLCIHPTTPKVMNETAKDNPEQLFTNLSEEHTGFPAWFALHCLFNVARHCNFNLASANRACLAMTTTQSGFQALMPIRRSKSGKFCSSSHESSEHAHGWQNINNEDTVIADADAATESKPVKLLAHTQNDGTLQYLESWYISTSRYAMCQIAALLPRTHS